VLLAVGMSMFVCVTLCMHNTLYHRALSAVEWFSKRKGMVAVSTVKNLSFDDRIHTKSALQAYTHTLYISLCIPYICMHTCAYTTTSAEFDLSMLNVHTSISCLVTEL
jgi:hypothetical protein